MSAQLFLDESKERSYVVALTSVEVETVNDVRRTLRSLVLPGQNRVHFKAESPARRKQILGVLAQLSVPTQLYIAGDNHASDHEARRACLSAAVHHAADVAAQLLVLELDDAWLQWDKQQLIELTRDAGCRQTLSYRHQRGSAEPLLWIPDAVAWCWARGREWRRLCDPLIASVTDV